MRPRRIGRPQLRPAEACPQLRFERTPASCRLKTRPKFRRTNLPTTHPPRQTTAFPGPKEQNPIEHACDLYEGQVFTTDGWRKPDGLCDSAWQTLSPFVMTLAHGGTNIYDGWMKNPASAMISCNDGFRPVSFLIETLEK